VSAGGEILERDIHLMEVNLSLGYPRRVPQCRMLTSIFHRTSTIRWVCIGDFWAASESLDDLIFRIGRLIACREYNTKSPLNGLAAQWAAQNSHLLPIDARPIAPPLKELAAEELLSKQLPSSTSSVAESSTPDRDPWAEKIVIGSKD
jgi:hypothetical protein